MRDAFSAFIACESVGLPTTPAAPASCGEANEPIGRSAMLHGLLTAVDVDRILTAQSQSGGYFGEIAIRIGLLTEHDVRVLLAGQNIRCCLELAETLALSKKLSIKEALHLLGHFLVSTEYKNPSQADVLSAT